MNRTRGKSGKFIQKTDEKRQVRSLRVTDSVWEAFGKYAEERGITRADWLEERIQSEEQHHVIAQPSLKMQPVKEPKKAVKSASVKRSSGVRYYLQLTYSVNLSTGKTRWMRWYWDGSDLIEKISRHPSKYAKLYDSKAGALTAARKLQRQVDNFARKVKQPEGLLQLKPVRVTWK
jgi:hypothetical protein